MNVPIFFSGWLTFGICLCYIGYSSLKLVTSSCMGCLPVVWENRMWIDDLLSTLLLIRFEVGACLRTAPTGVI